MPRIVVRGRSKIGYDLRRTRAPRRLPTPSVEIFIGRCPPRRNQPPRLARLPALAHLDSPTARRKTRSTLGERRTLGGAAIDAVVLCRRGDERQVHERPAHGGRMYGRPRPVGPRLRRVAHRCRPWDRPMTVCSSSPSSNLFCDGAGQRAESQREEPAWLIPMFATTRAQTRTKTGFFAPLSVLLCPRLPWDKVVDTRGPSARLGLHHNRL